MILVGGLTVDDLRSLDDHFWVQIGMSLNRSCSHVNNDQSGDEACQFTQSLSVWCPGCKIF